MLVDDVTNHPERAARRARLDPDRQQQVRHKFTRTLAVACRSEEMATAVHVQGAPTEPSAEEDFGEPAPRMYGPWRNRQPARNFSRPSGPRGLARRPAAVVGVETVTLCCTCPTGLVRIPHHLVNAP